MTEYEISDLMATYTSNLIQGQAIFITIFTAYVAVAYTTGRELSSFQVTFINICFVTFMALAAQGGTFSLEQIFLYSQQLAELQQTTAGDSEALRVVGRTMFFGVRILLVIGAMIFMWQVRHSVRQS